MSIELPAASVETAAKRVADRKSGHAKIWFGLAGFFVFMVAAMLLDNAGRFHVSGADAVLGGAFWVGLFASLGAVAHRRARQGRAAAVRAMQDPTLRWVLQERSIVAYDERGVPQLDVAFDVDRELQSMLTEVPAARATYVRASRGTEK